MGVKIHIRDLKRQPNFKKPTLLKLYKETWFSCCYNIPHDRKITHYLPDCPVSFMYGSSMGPENTIENCKLKFSKLVEKLVYL